MKTITFEDRSTLLLSKEGNKKIKFQYKDSLNEIYEREFDLEDMPGFENLNDAFNSINKNMISIKEDGNYDVNLTIKNRINKFSLSLLHKNNNNILYNEISPISDTAKENNTTSPGKLLDDKEFEEYKNRFLKLENEHKELRDKNEELKKKINEEKRKNDEIVKNYLKNMQEYTEAVKRNGEITLLVNE